MNKIKLRIVTPERVVLTEEVDQVSIHTSSGQITILPNHIPLGSQIVPGEIMIKKDKEEEWLAISGGMVEVLPGETVILADTAERVAEIDEARANEAKKRAEEVIKEKIIDSEEYAFMAAKLQKELARLKVVRRIKPTLGIYRGEDKKE
jgi:F-type H+-transporting ATPase subunit epsilon